MDLREEMAHPLAFIVCTVTGQVPAVKGTEIVVNACIKTGVERVVLTSSFAAIGYGHKPDRKLVAPGPDESTSTNAAGLELPRDMYINSKTAAERKAWELVEGTKLDRKSVV